MPTYKTPGVYIEEISKFPPSVVPVETAIPAFIGYTEKAKALNGDDLTGKPTRITSLLEFEELFGEPALEAVDVRVTEDTTDKGISVNFDSPPAVSNGALLPYSMRFFYANGGGPSYVISQGDQLTTNPSKSHFTNAGTGGIELLEAWDEPTLLVFPDATRLATNALYRDVVNAALSHCSKMQDRFTICDIRRAYPGETATNANVTNNFRSLVASDVDLVKYGAAYFPYVKTSFALRTDDDNTKVKTHTVDGVAGPIAADTQLSAIKTTHTAVYNAVKSFVEGAATVTLPPSGGVAGVYARIDASRGVWKAPANASLMGVIEPAIAITTDLNDGLNVDATSGKSVNAIRAFTGKGTLVWGARTLAGNDNENRYISVRRFLIFAEESVKKATASFVWEPNDANTWTKVRTMIENFLIVQWRDGALAGAKPEDAFYVKVGLNQTMSAQDILDGYMIVEIGLAIVRPAEFIVLRFAQMMQKS